MNGLEDECRVGRLIAIGVALLHTLAVGPLDLLRACIAGNAQHLVMIVAEGVLHAVARTGTAVGRSFFYAIGRHKVSYFVQRMRPSILALWLLGLHGSIDLKAQHAVHGLVLDARGDMPLVGAHIRLAGEPAGAYSDAQGRFVLHCTNRRVTIRVSHVGFHDAVERVDALLTKDDPMVVRLKAMTIELPQAVIRPQEPEVVYERKDLHVGDYLVNDDGVWVLVYGERRLWLRQDMVGQTVWKGGELHRLDTLFREIARASVPGDAQALERDHAGRPVVRSLDGAWSVAGGKSGFGFAPVDADVYRNAVKPWTDSVPGMLLGNTWTHDYPAFDHVAYVAASGEQRVVCEVVDRHWMEIFRSSYKYICGRSKVIAMDLAREHSTDPEIIAGFMAGVDEDLRYRPPYAPLYVVDSTLCVFDHHLERIRRFGLDLKPMNEIPITYQRDRDWDHGVVHDRATGAVYARFARGTVTWLRPVDLTTGALGTSTRLTHPYPEDVQVFDGHAYYVYRPFGSLQKRTLYREPLR